MNVADCFVSVVAPLHDDADIVASFVLETVAMLREHYAHHELVLVDDGSTDETVAVVRRLLAEHEGVRLIVLSRRFGQEIAISAGLDSVIGDYTAVLLPETDPPSLVPELVERSRRGSDVVYGIRRSRADEPLLNRVGTAVFYWLCNRLMKLALPRDSTHFRVLSRQAVNAMTTIKDRGRYLRTLSSFVGYDNQSFPYDLVHRRQPPRRKGLVESVDLALNIIVSNTTNPLRFASYAGFCFALLNVLYSLYVVGIFLFKERVAEGWVTTSLQTSGMFFFLFLTLAVLAEYLGRLVSESKGRPLYYVKDELASRPPLAHEERRNVVTDPVEGTASARGER